MTGPPTHRQVARTGTMDDQGYRIAETVGSSGATLWFTGLSAAGKTTVAVEVERRLNEQGRWVCLLDGDQLRSGLNADLGFSAADRVENVRRVSEVSRLFARAGAIALVALISPYRAGRERARENHAELGLPFYEIFMDAPLGLCEDRDPKGLYRRARAGALPCFTGVDDPYEVPHEPDLTLRPDDGDVERMAKLVLKMLADGKQQ